VDARGADEQLREVHRLRAPRRAARDAIRA